jgi:hypothetical protein
MIRDVVVISVMLIVPSVLMTPTLSPNGLGEAEGELGYRLVPLDVGKQIEQRGPETVLRELFDRAADWNYITDRISSGHREWIHVAARFYPVSDVAASIELDHALWGALERSPSSLLEAAGTDLPLERVCSEAASTPLDCLFDEAVADVNERGTGGRTALMEASSQGHAETVKFLIEKGAEIHAKAEDGSGAPDIALAKDRREVAGILKRYGASSRRE